MAKFDDKIYIAPKDPSSLSDILWKILSPSNPPADHHEFVDDVLAAKTAFYEGRGKFDENIMVDVNFYDGPKREAYYEAYILYLGMTLAYEEEARTDAAWYYFAQSRYYKGLYDTFDAVFFSLDQRYQEEKNSRQGGLAKSENETGNIRKAFIRIIEAPPKGGWKNEKQLLAAAEQDLQLFQESSGLTSVKPENLITRAKKWLKDDEEIAIAYAEHCSDPDKALKALRKKSTNLTDLLIKALIRIIESPPKGGWENLEQLLAVAEPKLQAIKDDSGKDLHFRETIRSSARRWLRNITYVGSAYTNNSRDPDEALYETQNYTSDRGWY